MKAFRWLLGIYAFIALACLTVNLYIVSEIGNISHQFQEVKSLTVKVDKDVYIK